MKTNTNPPGRANKVQPAPALQTTPLYKTDGKGAGRKGNQAGTRKRTTTQHHGTVPYDVRNAVYAASNGSHYYDAQTIDRATLLLYCPQNLDLRTELLRSGHQDLIKHLWKFYHVITLLYLQRWNKASKRPRGRKLKPREPESPYYPLKKQILRGTIGSHAEPVLAALILVGVIETDNHYVVGKHSKGYRFCEPYRSSPFRQVRPSELPRFPRRAKSICRHRIETDGSPEHRHLLDTLHRLTLDDSSYEFAEKNLTSDPLKRDYHLRSAEWIRTRQWFFAYDKRTGRVFNNITNLPKELRPLLRLDGCPLIEIDVANCQPFLMLSLYPNVPERETFALVVCSGQFYELVQDLLDPYGGWRLEDIKKATLASIFDRNRPTPSRIGRILQLEFPILAKQIHDAKRVDHNKLALHLQKLEADIIIGSVVRQIALGAKFPVLTIHDSILTLPPHESEVRKLLEEAFRAKFGVVPKLRVKHSTLG